MIHLLISHWPRKLLSLFVAIIVWWIVASSLTISKTITGIPVKIINVPEHKTLLGLLPSGYLQEPITLTLRGSKRVLQELNANNVQVVIDASGKGEQWIAKVDKQSLATNNPNIDLARGISDVSENEFVMHLTPLITAYIPVTVMPPIGEPPVGYHFVDLWPQHFIQKITGPQEEVKHLETQGLELTLNLDAISDKDLAANEQGEVTFMVPDSWKQVGDPPQTLNDPLAASLHIDFLQKNLSPLDTELPISLFFPLQNSDRLNPDTVSFEPNEWIEEVHGITLLKTPLFVQNVSKQFLDAVRHHIEIIVTPVAKEGPLPWTLAFINPEALQEIYLTAAMKGSSDKAMRAALRSRFQAYMRNMRLVTKEGKKLRLEFTLDTGLIHTKDVTF